MRAKDLTPGERYRVARSKDPVRDTWGGYNIELIEAGTHKHSMATFGYFKTEQAAISAAKQEDFLYWNTVQVTEDNIRYTERGRLGQWRLVAWLPSYGGSKSYATGRQVDPKGNLGSLVSVSLRNVVMTVEEFNQKRTAYKAELARAAERREAAKDKADKLVEAFTKELTDLFGESVGIYYKDPWTESGGGSLVFKSFGSAEELLDILKDSER